ncbi:type II toxin-antitoxin system TacA family antitoxin [Aquisphaera giovannonii]|nr:DUF1778 domain-containing protein [Aquisphaera giovannonii]
MADRKRRTARIEARITPDALDVVKRAAEIQGRSVSEFVVAAAQDAASKVVEDTHLIRLTVEEQIRFAELLIDPPPMSPALKRARKDHARLTRKPG